MFDWTDPLSLGARLSEEERLVFDSARGFVADQLAPGVVKAYADESFDPGIVPAMGKAGLLGCMVPEEFGGAGANHVTYGLVARAIEAVDSGYRSAMSVQSSLVMHPIFKFGSDAQRASYLPRLASGEMVGCFGLTEPDGGSDPSSMRTKAVRVDDGFKLNGSKIWITNSPICDFALVWAKLDGVIRGFIVERGVAGFTTPRIEGKLSLRASVTGEIALNDVFVPDTALLPGVEGLKGPFECLNKARLGIAWGAMGAAEACYAVARDYVSSRSVFGQTLASRQIIQLKLADMATEIALGLEAALTLSRQFDEGTGSLPAISLLKRNNCAKALTIARAARDMLGGNGISGEYHVMRHVQNLETVNTYEGTSDVHALILGRAITGENAF